MAHNAGAMVPAAAQSAVLMRSEPVPEGTRKVDGPNFDKQDPNDLSALMESMASIGFQGTSVSEAVRIIEQMVGNRSHTSVLGVSQKTRRMSQQMTKTRRFLKTMRNIPPTPSAPSFWASRPTSFPRVCAK